MDPFTVSATTAVAAAVFTFSFWVVSQHMTPGSYWRSWALSAFMLSIAFTLYSLDEYIPLTGMFLLPILPLTCALVLCFRAARQFSGRENWIALAVPATLTLLCVRFLAVLFGEFFIAFTAGVAIWLYLLALTAWEYWRDRNDKLLSRYGLVVVNAILFFSIFIHAFYRLHFSTSNSIISNDTILSIYMLSATVYVTANGAFCFAIAYERWASEQQNAARRDPLTGAFNRREFDDRLSRTLAHADQAPFALIQLDIDHFKKINDRFGHLTGDEALKKCTEVVLEQLRDNDCFARLGGEEFGVLLPGVTKEAAIRVAERLRNTIAQTPFTSNEGQFQLTVSAGVFHGSADTLDQDKLLRLVDDELYRSKEAGRNRISIVGAA